MSEATARETTTEVAPDTAAPDSAAPDSSAPVPASQSNLLAAPATEEVPQAAEETPTPDEPTLPTYDLSKFTLPEGVTIDQDAMKAAADLMRGMKLPQDEAQKLITFAAEREKATAQKGVEAFRELQNKWTGEVKADPEIGGTRLEASLAHAARAIDRLGVPGLREALHLTGAGNHPAVVKA
ncbi:MAG: hypothetical protein JO339_27960, partial [Alphaproteobacteria bacterium]|nr:hypothetical protein [Alphaproteobacteria bacterium]